MTDHREPDDGPPGSGDTQSEFGGTAGDVVQARDVHGGVHFHAGTASGPSTPPPRQLPGDVRGFVNRRSELEHLDLVLAGDPAEPPVAGITVIAGTAGVGKTTLALRWAHQVQDRFPDGQLYVNLRGYDSGPPLSPAEALDYFLRALGVLPGGIPADLDARAGLYRSLLAGRRFLVVLDNAVNERQVRPLLPGAAGSLALVTSRSRLSGLAAREGAHRLGLDVLTDEQAIALIRVVTAGQRRADDDRDLAELARLCARLPLALRIAAERAASRPLMSLDELIADLRDESGLWDVLSVGDDEDVDAVRAVFAWSYRALTTDAARAFRLLGLHPGPELGAEAAAALIGTPVTRTRRILDTLVGAHLVEEQAAGRYRLHDLLRAYAAEQAKSEETTEACQAAVRRCVAWYLHTAAAAQRVVEPSRRAVPLDTPPPEVTPLSFADRDAAMAWFHAERFNLVAAVRTAADHDMDDLVWRFPLVLLSYYYSQNPFEDWVTTGRLGLAAARRIGNRDAEAENLGSLGMAALQAGHLEEAAHHYTEALAIRRDLGDRYGEAFALNRLGLLDLRRRHPAAPELFQQARDIFHELGEEFWTAQLAANLADAHIELGDLATAEPLIRAAMPVFQASGELASQGDALVSLSRIAREQDRPHDALPLITEALDIAARVRSRVDQAYWGLELAAVQRALGRPDEALVSCHESAVLHRQIGDRTREALAWDATGCTYQDLDRPEDAIPFHRMAATVHHDFNDAWHEANALAHLARALAASGRADDSAEQRRRAVALLAGYDDARAAQLHASLRTADEGEA